MATDYTQLQFSGFLDYNSYRSTAVLPSDGTPHGPFTINVGLIFDRAHDPTPLLDGNWASRQQQIAELTNSNTLWATYGADSAKYQLALSTLAALNIPTVSQIDANNGYVSSAANRTIWVQLNESTFQTLFNTTVLQANDQSGNSFAFWNGNLSLPTSLTALGIKGLDFDSGLFVVGDSGADAGANGGLLPNPGGGTPVTLPQGPQSPGNDTSDSPSVKPQLIAYNHYHYPLSGPNGTTIPTGTIGLVEPGIGTALPSGSQSFSTLLTQYLQSVYDSTSITSAPVTDVALGGQDPGEKDGSGGERSLDVGIVAAINPQSPLVLYSGSGYRAHARADTYTAYQSAIWDTINNPQVITSSYGNFSQQPGVGSPFVFATQQLYIDAALRNITMLTANDDGGSGNEFGTGVTNVDASETSPYGITVGGTSISSPRDAERDPTLNPGADPFSVALPIVPEARSGVLATPWQLIQGGMVAMPYPSGQAPSSTATLIETVWNEYYLDGSGFSPHDGYFGNNTSTGGVDPTQAVPNYQLAFGLTPTTSDPAALVGRGTPDVAALAGGNMFWLTPQWDMTGLMGEGGTSAATPAWAALISQIDAVFQDQGLPQLGYMNDLLYLAAAIYPAAFNDITVGNNTSSFTLGGTSGTVRDGDVHITPTGFGYSAGPGYDMTTGLGSPNGLLLARTLSDIAHSQMYFASLSDVLDAGGPTGWQSGAAESLLFQTNSSGTATVDLQIGGSTTSFASAAADDFAWNNQFAEQVLQPYFESNLVNLFDRQSQGTVVQSSVADNAALGVTINNAATTAPQGTLTNSFGFVTFADGSGNTVQVARPVAVAETAGGADDQTATVRIRQNGVDDVAVTFYRVDDLNGNIAGVRPGESGYEALMHARAYHLTSGGTSLAGPGYGIYKQDGLVHVNAGDLIAMELSDRTTGFNFSGFSQANEVVNGHDVVHLWGYGHNTWGFEDTYGGGDRDFNDVVVGIDFTSASGSGLLV